MDTGCEGGAACRRHRVGIKIDPLLFGRYRIDRVPAVVYVPDVRIVDVSLSEGMEGNVKTDDHYTLYGDASLAHILEVFRRESRSRSILALLESLKGGLYHRENER